MIPDRCQPTSGDSVRRVATEAAPALLEEIVAASRREAAELLKSRLTDAMVQEVERLLAGSSGPAAADDRAGMRLRSGWYVYGITRAEAAVSVEAGGGVDGAPVEVVPVADLAAVVSPLDDTGSWNVGGPGEDALEVLGPRARAHESVLEQVMDHGAVLPLRFGVLYPDLEALRGVLSTRATAFRRTLDSLEGHREWGLTVSSSGKVPVGATPAGAADGRDYLARRRAERRSTEERTERLAQLGSAFHRHLERLSAAAVSHGGPPSVRRGEEVLLRGCYLVPTDATEAFKAACVSLLEGAPADLHLGGELTGPWPPYHFCDVSLGEVPA